MMPPRAVSTGPPRRHERVRAPASAAAQRSRQGHRNPCVAPPDRRATASARRPAHPIPGHRPGAARRATTPTPPPSVAATTPAGPPGHDPALAPRPARPPPRCRLPTQPARPTTNAAFHPRPGPALGPGEQQLGLPARARRTPDTGKSRSPPPQSGRSCTRPASTPHPTAPPPPGPTFSARRPTRCWPRTSSKRSRRPRPAGTSSRSSNTHPPRPHPRHHRAPDRRLGGPGRPQPRHGPAGRRPVGAVPHPRSGRQAPGAARRDPCRCPDHRHAQRRPSPPDERDHGAVGTHLPPRTARPHPALEPAASPARPTRIRDVRQQPPAAPGHRQRPTTPTTTRTDHRTGPTRPATHPSP